MNSTSVFALLIILVTITTTNSVLAQRNVNPYKNKERILIIDEANVYDPSKDIERKKLALKDSSTQYYFSTFTNTINIIETPSLIDEVADTESYSPIFMDTYQKHFDITNGIQEVIILAPQNDNKLYLIGKLANMPIGIEALLFYAFEGNSIQVTKLITFDQSGTPISVKEVQYYIPSSEEGMEGKMTCQLNADQTISSINYVESEEGMIPSYEQIYQIQNDGNIQEIALIDLSEPSLASDQE